MPNFRCALSTISSVAVATALATSPAAHAADAIVTIRTWSPIIETSTKMAAATEAKIPGVKIEYKIFNYPDYIVDLQTRAASGEMSDLIGLEPGALARQYQDFLMPLQDCAIKAWGPDWKDKFYPLAIDQIRLGNDKGDTNFYALPVLTQTINIWYTKPIFEKANLKPPTTYEEMLKDAPIFSQQGVAPLLVGAADGWQRRDVYMQLIHNVAPGLIYKAENGEAKFTEAPFVEAMTVWKKLFDDGVIQPGALGLSVSPQAMELTEGGRAAMFSQGAWWQQQAGRPNTPPLSVGLNGYAPILFPDVTGKGRPADPLGGIDLMVGISKTSKNPDAACKVLADWISGAGAQELINTFNDLPAFKGVEPQSYQSENQKEVWKLFTEEWLPKVRYARQLKSPAVKQALEDALAAVASGDQTPEQGMAAVQTAWQSQQK